MFEFKKICDAYESMTSFEKGLMLTEKSVKILARLSLIDSDEIQPLPTLAGFIIGSAVADGKINESEYVLMYPALVRVFGDEFDFASVKEVFEAGDVRKAVSDYTQQMLSLLSLLDEDLKEDVVMLCLCIASLDGKVSLKEKRYVKRLCKA